MGTKITVRSAESPTAYPAQKFIPVAVDNCLSFHFFGEDILKTITNRIPDQPPAGQIGSPTYSTLHAGVVGETSYFEMPYVDPDEFTYMAVMRHTDTLATTQRRPMIIGANSGNPADARGASIYQGTATNGRLITWYADGPQTIDAGNGTAIEWRMIIASGGAAGMDIQVPTNGQSASTTFGAAKTRLNNNFPVTVGGRAGAIYDGTFDVAAAAVWDRRLDSDEQTEMYLQMKTLYAALGITI